MSGALLDELAGPRRPLSQLETGPVLGGLCWVELEAFRRLGELSGQLGTPELAVWASGAAMAHAWRAAELERLLPVSVGLPRAEDCIKSPGSGVTEWLNVLARAAGGGDPHAASEVAAWYGLLENAYELRATFASPSADGQIIRSLGRLAFDVRSLGGTYEPVGGAAGGGT